MSPPTWETIFSQRVQDHHLVPVFLGAAQIRVSLPPTQLPQLSPRDSFVFLPQGSPRRRGGDQNGYSYG
jgi:hypothetical protein